MSPNYKFTPNQFVCTEEVEDELNEWKSNTELNLDWNWETNADFKELKKNCDHRKEYSQMAGSEKRYEDTKHNYDRTWRQVANLSLGVVVLSLGIMYQF